MALVVCSNFEDFSTKKLGDELALNQNEELNCDDDETSEVSITDSDAFDTDLEEEFKVEGN